MGVHPPQNGGVGYDAWPHYGLFGEGLLVWGSA